MPRELNPDIPEGFEQITMHAMSGVISKRYPSATPDAGGSGNFPQKPECDFRFYRRSGRLRCGARLLTDPDYLPDRLPPARAQAAVPVSIPQRKQPPAPAQSQSTKKGANVALTAGIIVHRLAVPRHRLLPVFVFLLDLFSRTEEVEVPQMVGQVLQRTSTRASTPI